MEAETLIITFVIFLTGAVLVAYAAQEIGHAQKQALLRLLRRGVISEEIHSEFVANIDELLKSPSTMDWILAAELREGLEQMAREKPAEDAGTDNEQTASE